MLPRVSLAFFMFAALCGATGMGWGIFMAVTHDHLTSPAHAHLNLLGWVTPALMGAFYAVTKERVSGPAPWVNFALSATGVATMAPSLAAMLMGVEAMWVNVGLAVGAFSALGGMLCFAGVVAIVLMDPAGRERKAQAA